MQTSDSSVVGRLNRKVAVLVVVLAAMLGVVACDGEDPTATPSPHLTPSPRSDPRARSHFRARAGTDGHADAIGIEQSRRHR